MTAEQMIIGRMMASRHQLAEAIAFIENKPGFFTDRTIYAKSNTATMAIYMANP